MECIYFFNIFSQDFGLLNHFELVVHIFIIILALILDDILAFRRHNKEFTIADSFVALLISLSLAIFIILPISLTPMSCTINLIGSGLMISVFMKTFMSLITKYKYTFKIIKFKMNYAPHYRRKYRHNKHLVLLIIFFFVITNIYLVFHLCRIIYIIKYYNI